MKILVACEESQILTTELRKLGHEAYSCDIEPHSGSHDEWHIQQDVIPILNGNCEFMTCDGLRHEIMGKWDMIIAFPPCTYLSNAGARHLYKGGKLNKDRYNKGVQAKEFFITILNADCDKICIENPVHSLVYDMPKFSQQIQPFEYGHPVSKKTRLWLKGLPLLQPTNIVKCEKTFLPSGSYSNRHNPIHLGIKSKKSKDRSKTFQGIAKAIATQFTQ